MRISMAGRTSCMKSPVSDVSTRQAVGKLTLLCNDAYSGAGVTSNRSLRYNIAGSIRRLIIGPLVGTPRRRGSAHLIRL
jgi:hypothetical protein